MSHFAVESVGADIVRPQHHREAVILIGNVQESPIHNIPSLDIMSAEVVVQSVANRLERQRGRSELSENNIDLIL